MSDKTDIGWTESTWNPVRGCTKISPGCTHCYASTFAERWRGIPGHPYEQGFDLRLVPEKLSEPLKWKKPRRIFVNSMSDLFHEGVPDEFIDQVFAVMALAKQHTFQVLTKRPERMAKYCNSMDRSRLDDACGQFVDGCRFHGDLPPWPTPHVHLGVSVESQKYADERIPFLLRTPAKVRFLSVEPMLGPVDLSVQMNYKNGFFKNVHELESCGKIYPRRSDIDWVIVGAESGPGRRPMQLEWAESLVDQCATAGVPVFVKQLDIDGKVTTDASRFPEMLRRQEYPK